MKPVCIRCQRFYFRPRQADEHELLERVPRPRPKSPKGKWKPYRLWAAEKLECPGCGAVILVAIGRERIEDEPGRPVMKVSK